MRVFPSGLVISIPAESFQSRLDGVAHPAIRAASVSVVLECRPLSVE
jgi:hypothetical protein